MAIASQVVEKVILEPAIRAPIAPPCDSDLFSLETSTNLAGVCRRPKEAGRMICPRCGATVASNRKFCGDWGTPLPWQCSASGPSRHVSFSMRRACRSITTNPKGNCRASGRATSFGHLTWAAPVGTAGSGPSSKLGHVSAVEVLETSLDNPHRNAHGSPVPIREQDILAASTHHTGSSVRSPNRSVLPANNRP